MNNSLRKLWALRSTSLLAVIGFTLLGHAQPWLRIVTENKYQIQEVPPDKVPLRGTFWSLQRTNYAPLPFNPYPELPLIYLGYGNSYVIDDSSVDYLALYQKRAEEQALLKLEWDAGLLTAEEYLAAGGEPEPLMLRSMMSSAAYENGVYLVDLTVTNSGIAPLTASFSIVGGTNFVPYDILAATNPAAPITAWQWLGIGYTSNRYTFANQPLEQAYYLLAKPAQTMVVWWGADHYGQRDTPFGETNVLQVAAGLDHNIALQNDGVVQAWGTNDYLQASVPTNLGRAMMVAAGWHHNVVLLTNGTVASWGPNIFEVTNVPPDLNGVSVISAQGLHTLALRTNGDIVAWGYNSTAGETNVPASLSNVVAIAAGFEHNLAVKADGTVAAWGFNNFGQSSIPNGLSNVVDVAAGLYHSLALCQDGTVRAWGRNTSGETNVPAGLTNVVAIAAGGNPVDNTAYSMALQADHTVVTWGAGPAVTPLAGLSNVLGIAAGTEHAVAIRTGPRTPVLTLLPTNQFQTLGGAVTFNSRGAGLYGVSYQWKTDGVNLPGATNATLTITNVQPALTGNYTVTVSNEVATLTSPNAALTLVVPPVITSMTLPTNQTVNYGKYVALNVTVSAAGQTNGFPVSYQWKHAGTNLPGATTSAYTFYADDDTAGAYSLMVSNAAGTTNVSWTRALTNDITVTNDLLLVYNTNSAASKWVKDYYLAHRPLVGGANVLGIGCTNTESFLPTEYTNVFLPQIQAWLTNNPTKLPQYIVLFYDIPARVHTNRPPWYEDVFNYGALPSVSYLLANEFPGWKPYITHINMGTTNDCKGYIDKLEYFGTNYSPGSLIISANATGAYGNTNYVLDGIRKHGNFTNGAVEVSPSYPSFLFNGDVVASARSGLLNAGIATNSVLFFDGLDTFTNGVPPSFIHPGPQTNVAGYMSWGGHSMLGANYPTDGKVVWAGYSSWWIIETIESFNGQRVGSGANFVRWFSPNAFGGTNYSNTPIGAVTHVEEPFLGNINNPSKYFGRWASGKFFGIAAWESARTPFFQAVGDPLVKR